MFYITAIFSLSHAAVADRGARATFTDLLTLHVHGRPSKLPGGRFDLHAAN